MILSIKERPQQYKLLRDLLDYTSDVYTDVKEAEKKRFNKTSDALESWIDYKDGDIWHAFTYDKKPIDNKEQLEFYFEEYDFEFLDTFLDLINPILPIAEEIINKHPNDYGKYSEDIISWVKSFAGMYNEIEEWHYGYGTVGADETIGEYAINLLDIFLDNVWKLYEKAKKGNGAMRSMGLKTSEEEKYIQELVESGIHEAHGFTLGYFEEAEITEVSLLDEDPLRYYIEIDNVSPQFGQEGGTPEEDLDPTMYELAMEGGYKIEEFEWYQNKDYSIRLEIEVVPIDGHPRWKNSQKSMSIKTTSVFDAIDINEEPDGSLYHTADYGITAGGIDWDYTVSLDRVQVNQFGNDALEEAEEFGVVEQEQYDYYGDVPDSVVLWRYVDPQFVFWYDNYEEAKNAFDTGVELFYENMVDTLDEALEDRGGSWAWMVYNFDQPELVDEDYLKEYVIHVLTDGNNIDYNAAGWIWKRFQEKWPKVVDNIVENLREQAADNASQQSV